MRFSFRPAFYAVLVGLPVLVACSDDGGSTSQTSTPPTEPAGSTSSSSGGSSSGESTSSSSGGSTSSSSGSTSSSGGSTSSSSSSGATTTSCDAAPAVSGTKTLATVTSAEKGLLCDFSACPFGGYGGSKSCTNGTTVKAKASQAACTGDATWTKCGSVAVSDYVACQIKINADPCNALATMSSDAACAPLKSCIFGQ